MRYDDVRSSPVPREIPDRSEILFGREVDLAHLLDRSERPGITAIVGRAQMGKSWLLTELARRLSLNAKRPGAPVDIPSLMQPCCLVGFAEAMGETADLLLRGAVDLYTRWLSNSTYWEQAQAVYSQQKKDWVGKTGEAVGMVIEKLSKLGAKPVEAAGGLVKETFDRLASANRELVSGGVQMPRLQVEDGRDLLALPYKITGCRLVLVFDQWEKSTGIEMEGSILDSFLRHLGEWPPCHIFLGVRSGERARPALKQLERDFPDAMEVYQLPPMHLDESSEPALLNYVRDKVPAAASASDFHLLGLISGYPGTIARWTSSFGGGRLRSLDELTKLASDANTYRFGEFEVLLPKLTENERVLSIRLALLPACSNAETWRTLRSLALEDLSPKSLDSLRRNGVLESISPPTYGHSKRAEAALQWFTDNCYEELRELCEVLIFSLGSQARDTDPRVVPYAGSLVDLTPAASRLDLSQGAQAICLAALSLFGFPPDPQKLLGVTSWLNSKHFRTAPLLALSLLITLNHAIRVQSSEQRDALLEELRSLSRDFPQDQPVRERLATGLFNTLLHTQREQAPERRDALLDELRALSQPFPQDQAVREMLAKGLFNMLSYAKKDQALLQRDALLEELRTLSRAFPHDQAVRKQFAMGLLNTLNHAKEEQILELRDALLQEMHTLSQDFPQDQTVRELLAKGLFNTLVHAKQERALERRDALLQELRTLSQDFPRDQAVREQLAKGLFNTLNDAKQEAPLGRCDALLQELRTLSQDFPQDQAVREQLAKSLFNTVNHAKQEQARQRCDALLKELLILSNTFPEDRVAR
jgi:hypothetical protein